MSTADVVRAIAPYLRDWLQFQAGAVRLPGLQAAVRYRGDLVLDEAIGVADERTGEPLTGDHLFRIASHSKTFTATAVLQLAERGRLRLDDPIGQWVPRLREAGAPVAEITLRELLGHQGGVNRDGLNSDFWQRLRPFPDVEDLLTTTIEDGEVYRPNEEFKYSNIGYGLLGLAIEAASGQSYDGYLRAHILDPLGLRRTGAEYDADRAQEYATGHTGLLSGSDTRETIKQISTGALAPATGLYSTARELTRYLAAHALGEQELLTDRSKRVIQRLETVIENRGKETGRYGVGMSIAVQGDRTMVGHGGAFPGQLSRSFLDPKDGLAITVLTNAIDGPAERLAIGLIALIELALDAPEDAPPTPPEAGAAPTYTGRFANLWGVADVVDLGGRLVIIRPADPDPASSYTEVTPIDADHLQLEPNAGFGPVGEKVTYSRDEQGAISSVRIGGASFWPIEDFRQRRSALAQESHHS